MKYIKVYKKIGADLKEHRKKLKLTQEQLAQKCGRIDRAKISDIENGKEDYMFSTLLQICEALDLSIELREK